MSSPAVKKYLWYLVKVSEKLHFLTHNNELFSERPNLKELSKQVERGAYLLDLFDKLPESLRFGEEVEIPRPLASQVIDIVEKCQFGDVPQADISLIALLLCNASVIYLNMLWSNVIGSTARTAPHMFHSAFNVNKSGHKYDWMNFAGPLYRRMNKGMGEIVDNSVVAISQNVPRGENLT